MTTGQMSELKDLMSRQNEQTKMMLESLARLADGVSEVVAGLSAIGERLALEEKKAEARKIMAGLVARGTITREEADEALKKAV